MYDAANYQNGSAAPAASPDDAPGQTVIVGGTGADDSSQRPGCDTIFISTAQVDGSVTSGWKSIPNVVGFYVDRNITYNSVTAPIYIESGKDFSKVKRVVVTGPGKPRDAWKYSNLFRNSLLCAVSNSSMAVTQEEILIAAPIWLAQDDSQAGAGQSSDLYFSDGGWSVGSKSKGPGKADISSYTVMDDLIKRFANQEEFPALTSVTVAGHSLGASFSQRYAMVRNDDASTDSLLRFWIGNPGAYVWPSPDRPVTPSNTSCASEVDEWAYGVSRSLPAYVKGVKNNVSAVYERYRSRVIQYALGMDDDGPGDTHCEAQYQGSSHLERGQNLQKALEAMEGGMPASQTFNYVPNTSHQDYLMMSDPNSQDFLFVADLDAQRSTATQAGNTSTGKKTATNGNSSGAGIPEIPTTIFVLIGLSSVFMFLFH